MIIIAGAFVFIMVFIMAISVLLRPYTSEVRKEKAAALRALQMFPREGAGRTEVAAVKQAPTGREPDDPARLGIVVLNQMDKPAGAGEWDAFLKKIFEESGALKTKEGEAVIRRMQMRPAHYKAVMKRLDEEISQAEVAAYRNARDPSLQKRLEMLYQMKALSRVLEKNGIVNPRAAVLPDK
jgi:hypothetical protein